MLNDVTATLGGVEQRAWVVQVIAIAAAVLAPPLGLASDLVGRRWILIFSMLLGLAGALISGQGIEDSSSKTSCKAEESLPASSMNMLIAGRVVCACGNGAQGISLAIPSEVLPRRYRPFGQAFCSGSVGKFFQDLKPHVQLKERSIAVFNIAGLLAAGGFIKHNVGGVGEGWRYVFHIEAILWGTNALLLFLVYKPPSRTILLENAGVGTITDLTLAQKLRKIDILGAFLLTIFIVPFMLGLGWYVPFQFEAHEAAS